MTDKEREVFEKWAVANGYGARRQPGQDVYISSSTNGAWDAWQAAAAHYSQKLMERDAVLAAAAAIRQALNREFAKTNVTSRQSENVAKAALRAAGLRFRDEA